MKKAISLFSAMAIVTAMSSTVYAADTTITPDSSPQTGTTTVTYTQFAEPTYTVTIPESVEIDGDPMTIKAENVVLAEGFQLKVTITGTSEYGEFLVDSSNGIGGDSLEYEVKDSDDNDYSINETVLMVNPRETSEGEIDLYYTLKDGEVAKYSGEYSGTMTFTVSVETNQNQGL